MRKQNEFDQMLAIAKHEIERDAPKIAKNLDLSAGAQDQGEPEMIDMLQRNWSNPQVRQWLNTAYSPDQQVALYLKAANVTNPDGTPMTVHQYQKLLESTPSLLNQPAAPPDEALAPAGVHTSDEMASAIAQHPTGTPLAAAPPSASAPDTAPATQPSPLAPGGAQ